MKNRTLKDTSETDGQSVFIDPDDIYKDKKEPHRSINGPPENEKPSLIPGNEYDVHNVYLSPDEMFDSRINPNRDKKDTAGWERAESIERIPVAAPSSLEDLDDIKPFNQLDQRAILKKTDIDSPLELLSPDEIEDSVEEEFESNALQQGTVVYEKLKILRILKENRDRNTYLVQDIKITDKKLILREFIPAVMPKEEYMERRTMFADTVRLLSAFRHPNLVSVYENFRENNREYYTMDMVEGLSLLKLCDMNTKPFSQKEVVKWGVQLCETLEFFHYRPKPFTISSLNPEQIMVDQEGVLKIINYDLQRFFNPKRTLKYMPDNPAELYEDISILGRLLYFLATKNTYSDLEQAEWPKGVNEKFKKLIMTACGQGQKSFGEIREFRRKLEDSLREEKEQVKRRRKWAFPAHKIDFSFIGRGIAKILSLNPLVLGTASLSLIFVISFSIFSGRILNPPYRRPQGPLTFVTAGHEMNIYKTIGMERIFTEPIRKNISFMEPATGYVKPEKSAQRIPKNIILTGYTNSTGIGILDSSSLEQLLFVNTESPASKAVIDENGEYAYILLPDSASVEVLKLGILELVNTLPTGINPADISYIPVNAGENKMQDEGDETPSPVLAVSNKGSGDVMFINASTGRYKSSIRIKGIPGAMALSPDKEKLYVLDLENSELVTINLKDYTITDRLKLEGDYPADLVYDSVENRIWVAMKGGNSINIIDMYKEKENITVLSDSGRIPAKIRMAPEDRNIWVLYEGSRRVSVYNSISARLEKTVELDKIPTTISFEKF